MTSIRGSDHYTVVKTAVKTKSLEAAAGTEWALGTFQKTLFLNSLTPLKNISHRVARGTLNRHTAFN